MKYALLVLGFASAITALVSSQQTPTPVFRADVEAISVDAFVTDRSGNPVLHLQRDDFEVLEDGVPQTLSSFGEVNIPVNPARRFLAGAPRVDVATNDAREGRLYVIALDEVDPDLALKARHYLRRFIERHFEPHDIGAVVNVGRASRSEAQDFTSDRGLLVAAIDKLKGWPSNGISAAPLKGWQSNAEPPSLRRRAQAAALKALIASLANMPGRRKALIYVTRDVGDVFGVIDYRGGVRSLQFDDLRAAMIDAMRGGVAIYVMDPCGLSPGGTLGEREQNENGSCHTELDTIGELRKMSEATGGFAVVNSNGVDQALEQIVRENSSYYVLGFVSTNRHRDGRYRRLEVRVTRPTLTVRARDGYIAASQAKPSLSGTPVDSTLSPSVRNVIGVPLANSAVPMKAFAAAFKGLKGKDATVLIAAQLDVSKLGLRPSGDSMQGQVEVASVAINAIGKITRGPRQVIDLALMPDSYARATVNGLRVLATATLPTGRYQLRVAGGNTRSTRAGSVMYDLEVPDFGKGPLTLSNLVLTERPDQAVTVRPNTTASIFGPPPTLNREFATGAAVSIYAEAYDNASGRGPHAIELKVEVRDSEGRTVRKTGERRSRDARGTEAFSMTVPFDIDPGSYVIRVEAVGGGGAASRDIPISVH